MCMPKWRFFFALWVLLVIVLAVGKRKRIKKNKNIVSNGHRRYRRTKLASRVRAVVKSRLLSISCFFSFLKESAYKHRIPLQVSTKSKRGTVARSWQNLFFRRRAVRQRHLHSKIRFCARSRNRRARRCRNHSRLFFVIWFGKRRGTRTCLRHRQV